MWDWTEHKGQPSGFAINGPNNFSFNATSFATAVARVGFLLTPQLMIYGLGGVASVNDKYTLSFDEGFEFGGVSASRTGYDVGAGFSWMLTPNWDFFVEYNYMNFGTNTVSFSSQPSTEISTIRISQINRSFL